MFAGFIVYNFQLDIVQFNNMKNKVLRKSATVLFFI